MKTRNPLSASYVAQPKRIELWLAALALMAAVVGLPLLLAQVVEAGDVQGGELSENPELTVSRRFVAGESSVLAANPELLVSRAFMASRLKRGLDADSARYAALGRTYAAKAEWAVFTSPAWYAALGRSRGEAADVARWAAFGRYYTDKYERAAAASTARYAALAEYYAAEQERAIFSSPAWNAALELARGIDADSARWAALGKYYTDKYERAAAASSARYAAQAQAVLLGLGLASCEQDATDLASNPELKYIQRSPVC